VNSIAKEIKKLLTALLRYLFSTLLAVTLKTGQNALWPGNNSRRR
jgi:hypothetical protein